jgi:hypothetical protein
VFAQARPAGTLCTRGSVAFAGLALERGLATVDLLGRGALRAVCAPRVRWGHRSVPKITTKRNCPPPRAHGPGWRPARSHSSLEPVSAPSVRRPDEMVHHEQQAFARGPLILRTGDRPGRSVRVRSRPAPSSRELTVVVVVTCFSADLQCSCPKPRSTAGDRRHPTLSPRLRALTAGNRRSMRSAAASATPSRRKTS